MENNHWPIWLLLAILIVAGWWVLSTRISKTPVATPTPSVSVPDTPVATPTPETLGIIIDSPMADQTVAFPLTIKGRVTGDGWTGFEGQVGAVELYNAYDEKILTGVPLTATAEDWMQLPTEFSATIGDKNTIKQVKTDTGYLLFHNENPSDLRDKDRSYRLPIKFDLSSVAKQKVTLFYYNQKSDPSTQCVESAILPVERQIPTTDTPVRDTINLLIQGKITAVEKNLGFTTGFPLEGFSLKGANLKSGEALTLEFADPLSKIGGGSCRVSLLRWQIEKTAKQFPNVKTVKIIPDSLFQP